MSLKITFLQDNKLLQCLKFFSSMETLMFIKFVGL